MHEILAESAKRVMELAASEARALNHQYVGTEHILLGLLLEGSRAAAGTLASLGLNSDSVRSEIEKIVRHEPRLNQPAELPLTPRAKRVIQFASEEAACVNLPQVVPDHLLIGLIREPDGVAGQVMRNLGLQLEKVRAEALKIRMAQLRIVERAVRPVRAGIAHKRKMREELLAHLTAIYQEEFVHANGPLIAMETAAKRFGRPEELSRELQSAVPIRGRMEYYIQRWVGWRAPESALRMMLRVSALSFLFILALVGVPVLVRLLYEGWDQSQARAMRNLAELAVLMPAAQLAMGLCYYKIRNSLWGVFGARRSRLNAVLWTVLAGLVAAVTSIGLLVSAQAPDVQVARSLATLGLIAIAAAAALLLLAKALGPAEIRDTIWATLDLQAV